MKYVNFSEMENKVKDIQESLICKQKQVEELEKAVAETSRGVEAGQNQVRGLQEELKMQEQSHLAVTRDYQLQLDILNKVHLHQSNFYLLVFSWTLKS